MTGQVQQRSTEPETSSQQSRKQNHVCRMIIPKKYKQKLNTEKSVGEMTMPFRKSLVPFIFSSPPETHPTFHVFQCGAPLEMITCASHLCGDWVHIGLGTDTLAHSQGCIWEREQRESIEKESPGLFWSVRFSHYSFCTPPTGLLFVPSTLFLT